VLNEIAFPSAVTRRAARAGLFLLALLMSIALMTPGMGPPETFGLDNMAHTAAFALLGAVGCIAWPSRPAAVWMMVWFAFLAAATELAQSALPYRTGSLTDAASDILGAALGIILVRAIRHWRTP